MLEERRKVRKEELRLGVCIASHTLLVHLPLSAHTIPLRLVIMLHCMTILYATETGNSLDVAEQIARAALLRGFQIRLVCTDEYPLVCCQSYDITII